MRGHTKSLDANDKLIQTRSHVRNAIASRERQVVMRKVKSTITSTDNMSTGLWQNISWRWELGLLGNIQQPWTAVWPKANSQFLLSPMERRHQPVPGFREFRPGQPTAGRMCSRKVPEVTTSAFPHNATEAQGSCPQRSSEVLELSQGWLEALLPSHRWIRWEIATSGRIKHWGGIPGFLREPTLCGQTMSPTWPSEELCAMLGQWVRDTLFLRAPVGTGL